MSKIRENIPQATGDLDFPVEGDFEHFEVFIQLAHGKRHVHAGHVDAPDAKMALLYAREHYGRDEPCVSMWVVPRAAMVTAEDDQDVIWPRTDQSYRLARGYPDIRKRWQEFRKERDVDAYQKGDLKETF